jgi:hypothetical protein
VGITPSGEDVLAGFVTVPKGGLQAEAAQQKL